MWKHPETAGSCNPRRRSREKNMNNSGQRLGKALKPSIYHVSVELNFDRPFWGLENPGDESQTVSRHGTKPGIPHLIIPETFKRHVSSRYKILYKEKNAISSRNRPREITPENETLFKTLPSFDAIRSPVWFSLSALMIVIVQYVVMIWILCCCSQYQSCGKIHTECKADRPRRQRWRHIQ